MDGKKSVRIDNLSKLTKIEDLRDILVEHFEAEPKCQRLFYRGKQVNIVQIHILRSDVYCLFTDSVELNLFELILLCQAALF